MNPLLVPPLLVRARSARRYARSVGITGIDFADFGVALGRRLLLRGEPLGISYLLNPVSIVRYFEFPFVYSCLPAVVGQCLDVASPRLFAVRVATEHPDAHIDLINPDRRDNERTRRVTKILRMANLSVFDSGIEALTNAEHAYDCIWSISVVEHIAGEGADERAVATMISLLRPGGRLIITVPVDRKPRVEYRDADVYGLGRPTTDDGRAFFQRVYDHVAVQRLIAATGHDPDVIRWFGERRPGTFVRYEAEWLRDGRARTVDDPREIADGYAEFATWDKMPGMGVCGFMVEKPR